MYTTMEFYLKKCSGIPGTVEMVKCLILVILQQSGAHNIGFENICRSYHRNTFRNYYPYIFIWDFKFYTVMSLNFLKVPLL